MDAPRRGDGLRPAPAPAPARGLRAFRRQFPHVDDEVLALFAESFSGDVPPAPEAVLALAEMEREAHAATSARASGARQLHSRDCRLGAATAPQAPPQAAGAGAGAAGGADGGAEGGARGGAEAGGAPGQLAFEGGAGDPHVGTVLRISGLDVEDASAQGSPAAVVVLPTGEALAVEPQAPPVSFLAAEYGAHELVVGRPGGERRYRFMVTSPLGEFAEALDHFNDAYDWGWDGGWTEELEEAAMMLLVALDDHFTALTSNKGNTLLGEMTTSTVSQPRRRIEKHLAKALEGHDVLALGRAVSGLRSLLLAQSLLDVFSPAAPSREGDLFYDRVLAFERARFAATSPAKRAEVKAALSRLIAAADAHVACLQVGEPRPQQDGQGRDFAARWQGELRGVLVEMLEGADAVIHPLPFQRLRGGGGGYMADMMASVVDSFGSGQAVVQRAETTEAMCSLQPQLPLAVAEAKVFRWVESLVDESIQFGSPMSPFELHAQEPWIRSVSAAIQSLLSLGLGYVTQGDNVAATSAHVVTLLDRVKATLPLWDHPEFLRDRRRRDRLKDVCRVVRAARRKGQRLTLAVSTDFGGAMRALKRHHEDSWVGPHLEEVWGKMAAEGKIFAFELWLRESQDAAPKLVAADFGHPHTFGRAYYVATRFFDRAQRTLQPGFILAFAEAECLRRAGFELWDLGGADNSPMMQYKPQVAIEMNRSEFLRRLRKVAAAGDGEGGGGGARRQLPLCDPGAAPPAGGEYIPTAVVFDDLGEEELWGFASLRQLEARPKVAPPPSRAKPAKRRAGASGAGSQTLEPPPRAAAAGGGAAQAAEAAKAPSMTGAGAAAAAPPAAAPTALARRGPGGAAAGAAAGAAGAAGARPPEELSPGGLGQAAAKAKFLALFRRLVAEGASQEEAAATALRAAAVAAAPAAAANGGPLGPAA